MKEDEETRLLFSQLDHSLATGLTAAQVTCFHLDQSDRLTAVLKRSYPSNNLHILGELQFAFVCFLCGLLHVFLLIFGIIVLISGIIVYIFFSEYLLTIPVCWSGV